MKIQKSLFLGLLLFFLLAGCVSQQAQSALPAADSQAVVLSLKYSDKAGAVLLEKNISVSKGADAFDAIKENVPLDFEMYSMGPFIKSINGITPPAGYYLALYVNSQYADRGITGYSINEDTQMEWKTEAIQLGPVS